MKLETSFGKKWRKSKRRKSYTPLVTSLLGLGDVATLGLAFAAAYWFRFYSGVIPVTKGIPPVGPYLLAFPLIALVFLFVFKTSRLYRKRERFSLTSEAAKVIRAVSLGFFILMALHFLYRGGIPFSRAFALLAWSSSILFLSIARGISNQVELWILRRNQWGRKAILIGMGEAGLRLIHGMESDPRLEFNVLGVVGTQQAEEKEYAGYPILGSLESFDDILKRSGADVAILTAGHLEHKQIVSLMLQCEKNLVEFKLVPDMFEILSTQFNVTHINGVPLLGLKEIPLVRLWNRFIKRSFDILGAFFGLIVISPILLIASILIKFSSKGPLIYLQERCGEDGRIFNLYKFRTMKVDAEKETGPVWASENDPRRTAVGQFLRRVNWDELPQLWNVLKGDMSLVGPRPERPHFVDQFKEDVPRYMSRHLVRSGITGWAQVNGLRGNTDIRERVKYDLFYMENWSLIFDIKILVLTLFRGNLNAY